MSHAPVSRRDFLQTSATALAGATLAALPGGNNFAAEKEPLFQISLAEWSLNMPLFAKKMSNLDFAKVAKDEFGIDAVEYVNQFFMDKATDSAYLADLKKRADDVGVKSLLIMIDREGNLGDPSDAGRTKAVENHYKWVEAAKTLGCHSIRVNAGSDAKLSREEQAKLATDGLRRLSEFGAKHGLNVIVENHGGLSSDGAWLAGVIKEVNLPNCGTLPDFGNFRIGPMKEYDRYQGVTELMPYAKGVSAKSHDFDAEGNETKTDYRKMLKIVLDAGYRGYIGIEYEGGRLSPAEGIKATKALLEKVRGEMSA